MLLAGFQPKMPLPRFGEPPPIEDSFSESNIPAATFPPSPPSPTENYIHNRDDQESRDLLDAAIRADEIIRQRQR